MSRNRSGFSFIPEELLIEVISRLPLKSAARFKCVSKRWEYLISNSTFVASRTKVLVFSKSRLELFSFHSINHEAFVETVQKFPVPENLLLWRCRTVIAHCSCDGLLLIQIDDNLFVWNPLTGFFRKVLFFSLLCRANDPDYDFVVGLCYDPTVNEYKVLLSYTHDTVTLSSKSIYVATCGRSRWKRLKCDVSRVNPGPVFKGYIHWYCQHDTNRNQFLTPHCIVYFDPSTNNFIDVPMPQHKNGEGNYMLGLGVLDGCLCMARWDDPGDHNGKVEVLVMKEYGKGDSWATMFVISYMGYDTVPLFVTKSGKALFHIYDYRCTLYGLHEIKSYDAIENSLSDISIPTRHDDYIDVVLYEENLFSPSSYNWDKFDPNDI